MTVRNLLIVLILCSVVGAFTGLMLGDVVGDLYLGIIAALLATAIAAAARNLKIPQLVGIYSALAIERSIQARVIMTPMHAKMLHMALARNLANYEQKFGEIRLPQPGSSLANSFFSSPPEESGDDEDEK